MIKQIQILCLFLIFCTLSCTTNPSNKKKVKEEGTVKLLHAEGFTIQKKATYTLVTLLNPWKKEEVFDRYYLVHDAQTMVPNDGQKVVVPLTNMAINSNTHIGFLAQLNELDRIVGVCSAEYVYNDEICKKVKQGAIRNLGDAFNIDQEGLLMLHPKAVMTSGFNAEDESAKRIKQSGITLLYNNEWQEKSLLGRAEWIKFVALFFDKSQEADSIFLQIEKQYEQISRLAQQSTSHPTILSGQNFRGTWSMPAGNSYMAQLFRDAGASYFYQKDPNRGSVSASVETALVHFNEADFWIGVQTNSLAELAAVDQKHTLFKAFKSKNVYNYNKRMTATGGNDYWESGVSRPDLILSDLIFILYPALLPGHTLYFMNRLL